MEATLRNRLDVEVVERHLDPEGVLERDDECDQGQRVDQTGVEEVGARRQGPRCRPGWT